MIIIFLPFIQSLMLLAASKLVELQIFANYKIIIMTVSFLLINLSMSLLILFAIVKSAFAVINSDFGRAVSTVVTKIPVPRQKAPEMVSGAEYKWRSE